MKKAIIVGATSGIGKGLAELLVEKQYQVGITGRRTERLEALTAQKPDSYISRTFDVTDTKEISDKLDALTAELGGLDLLIICSGTGDENNGLEFAVTISRQ